MFFKANDNARAFETFTDIICTLAACLTAAIITLCVSLQLRHEQLKPPFGLQQVNSDQNITLNNIQIFEYSAHFENLVQNVVEVFSSDCQTVSSFKATKRFASATETLLKLQCSELNWAQVLLCN